MDAAVRKRQYRLRSRRFRARQRQGVRVVHVEVSDRVLTFLLETHRLTEAEANDRGTIARRIAELAEDAVSSWEAKEGRISTA
jgi:hypothetical protein